MSVFTGNSLLGFGSRGNGGTPDNQQKHRQNQQQQPQQKQKSQSALPLPDKAVDPIIPTGKTVDERLKSMQQNPLYADQNDRRLFNHVTREYQRAYPGEAQYDEFGKMERPQPSIQPGQVQTFDPSGTLGRNKPLKVAARDDPKMSAGRSQAQPMPNKGKLSGVGEVTPTDWKINGATKLGPLMGYNVAAQALNHFRNGDGSAQRVNPEWLLSDKEILKRNSENRSILENNLLQNPDLTEALSNLKDGESLNHTLNYENKDISPKTRSDLRYASGKGNLDTSADVTFTRKGDQIVIQGNHNNRWHDRYDWQDGTSFFYGAVTGDEMNDLVERGQAKPFDMDGVWDGNIAGTIPIDTDGNLGQGSISWSNNVNMSQKEPEALQDMDPKFYHQITQGDETDWIDNPPIYSRDTMQRFRFSDLKRGTLTRLNSDKSER